jgi:hypothetical protein
MRRGKAAPDLLQLGHGWFQTATCWFLGGAILGVGSELIAPPNPMPDRCLSAPSLLGQHTHSRSRARTAAQLLVALSHLL